MHYEPLSWSGFGQFFSRVVNPAEWGRGAEELVLASPFVVANFAIGIPLGLLLVLAARPRWVAAPLLLLVVFGVEFMQSFAYGGSTVDILANVLGGVIGLLLGILMIKIGCIIKKMDWY